MNQYSRAIVAALAILVGAPGAIADPITGGPRGATYVFPIPGQGFFDGGFLFVDGFGPDVGSIITNTTFDIRYVSDGTTPASELDIHLGVTVNDTFLETVVTGADLGFGSGPGTFVGTISTLALNGEATSFFGPSAALSLEIGSINDPPLIEGSGYFDNSSIIFDIIPVPEPCTLVLLAMSSVILVRRRRAS